MRKIPDFWNALKPQIVKFLYGFHQKFRISWYFKNLALKVPGYKQRFSNLYFMYLHLLIFCSPLSPGVHLLKMWNWPFGWRERWSVVLLFLCWVCQEEVVVGPTPLKNWKWNKYGDNSWCVVVVRDSLLCCFRVNSWQDRYLSCCFLLHSIYPWHFLLMLK